MSSSKAFLASQQPAGSQSDTLPPAYDAKGQPFRTSFASVSLHTIDRIRFLNFPSHEIADIRATIQQYWRNGIQTERPYSVSYEFKLRGAPWSGSGTGPDAVPAQILMREIFSRLYSMGWIMTASTDVSAKGYDKDTMVFRKQPVPPPAASWVAISFKQGHKLRFLGAPPDLIAAMSQTFQAARVLSSEARKTTAAGYHEFKLHGAPWYASGEDTMRTRQLILQMIETMEMHGWSLYASIDQNSGPSNSSNASVSETDVWYCVKSADWTPGSIILHR